MRVWAVILLLGMQMLAGCEFGAQAPDVVIRGKDNTYRTLKPIIREDQQSGADDVQEMVNQSIVHVQGQDITVREWIRQQEESSDGQVLFPRWDVRRRGATKVEVRFTYTLLHDDYTVERRGYSWQVDQVLRLVGPPVVLNDEDIERQTGLRDSSGRQVQGRESLFQLE